MSVNAPAIAPPGRRIPAWSAAALFAGATVVTRAGFMGDTPDYVESIVTRNSFFWEFGHLLWRPLGLVVHAVASPLAGAFVGPAETARVTLVLIVLSWLGGLIGVLSLAGLLNHLCRRRLVAWTTLALFVFAQSLLNYVQTGSSYVPGLGMLMLGLYLLIARSERGGSGIGASVLGGLALATSVLFWFPYVLVLPAALVAPLFVSGFSRRRLTRAGVAVIACAALGAAAYGAVMLHLGIHDTAGVRAWMDRTSRGSGSPNRGVARAVFGFGRSFINMGNDGMLFKRFMLHDPFNPVSAWDLLRLSLWKLAAFYVFLAALLWGVLRSAASGRLLILLFIGAAPVLGFAVYWQGGDPERYFAIYPLLLIALAVALESARTPAFIRALLLAFVALVVVNNCLTLARPVINRQQAESAARIAPLAAQLKPGSLLFAANWADDVVNFTRSFPFDPINRGGGIRMTSLITPGEADVAYWRRAFAERVEAVWAQGGDVWLSRRLHAERPKSDWNWNEGDDPRVSWTDLYTYAAGLELGPSAGGEDGFELLAPSDNNRRYLERNR